MNIMRCRSMWAEHERGALFGFDQRFACRSARSEATRSRQGLAIFHLCLFSTAHRDSEVALGPITEAAQGRRGSECDRSTSLVGSRGKSRVVDNKFNYNFAAPRRRASIEEPIAIETTKRIRVVVHRRGRGRDVHAARRAHVSKSGAMPRLKAAASPIANGFPRSDGVGSSSNAVSTRMTPRRVMAPAPGSGGNMWGLRGIPLVAWLAVAMQSI